jgi:translocation and assembly module TamB
MKSIEPDFPTPPRRHTIWRVLRRSFLGLAWGVGGLLALAVLAVIVLAMLVNVDGVHRYLLGLAERQASAALGLTVDLQNFTVDVPKLRVDLYGLTIDGASPYVTPPLLRVDHVGAEARIVSLFRLKWYLNSVEVDHPVAWVKETANGESNIPHVSGGKGKSQINLFSLAIRHFVLDRGQVYFNDHPHALDADLHNLRLETGYNTLASAYQGAIAYRNGRVKSGAIQPVPNDMEASFTLAREAFQINQGALAIGNSKVAFAGTLRNFDSPEVNAQYDATIDGAQLRTLLHNPQVPTGVVQTIGSVTYRNTPSRPPIESLNLSGKAKSDQLWLNAGSLSAPIKNLSCEYSYASGVAKLKDFRAQFLGSEIEAEGSEKAFGEHQHGSVKATMRGLSIADSELAFSKHLNPALALNGGIDATASASWGPALKNLKAAVDARAVAQLNSPGASSSSQSQERGMSAPAGNLEKSAIPIQAQIHAIYTRDNGRLQLANSFVRTTKTSLTLNGVADRTSSISVHFISSDLSELAALANTVEAKGKTGGFRAVALSGKAAFQGVISGAITAPQIRGSLSGSGLGVNGSRWRSLRAGVELSPSGVQIQNADIEPASQGNIGVNAKIGLQHWSFSKTNAVEASLTASNLKLADLIKLTHQAIPVAGTLNANLHVRGTLANPAGSGNLILTDGKAYDQFLKSATVRFSAANGEINGQSNVQIAGGVLTANGIIQPGQHTFQGQIASNGIHIEQLAFLKSRNLKAGGDLLLNVSGHGTFNNPEMNGTLQVSNASIENRSFSSLGLRVSLSNRIVHADLASVLIGAPLNAQATVNLNGNYPAQVSLDTGKLPIKPLLALYAPEMANDLNGETQIHLSLKGPLKDRQALVGEITVPVLSLSYGSKVKMAMTSPIRAEYGQGDLRLQPTTIHGTDTDLHVQGTIPVFSKTPMSLQVLGSINLQLGQLLIPNVQSSGLARINIHAASAGGLGGQIELVNANLSTLSFPIGLQNGNGVLTLNGSRIDVTKFNGSIGGGTVTAQGGVTLQPKLGFDLGMTAKNVNVLYPQGVRDSLNANLSFTGSTEQALLGGTVGITDVSFTPAFDLMSMVGQFSSGVSAPTGPGFTQNVKMNVAVHSTNILSPSSRTLSVTGTTDLFVRGTMSHPSLVGRANLTGGNLIFHGDRFVLTGGTVQFVNPNTIRPVLNLSLTTTIEQYDIDLRFAGPAYQLKTQYTSNPALPQADIISLLAFGTTTEAQATNRTPANQAAESLIASQVSSQVTSRISKIAGISQLSISPVLAGGTAAGPPGAVITVRQQITGNLFITFSTNVASTQSETIQGEYKLSPRVAVSATRDPNGGFAVDALIKKSW